MTQLVYNILGTGTFWIIVILAPLVALLPDLFIKLYKTMFYPTVVEAVMNAKKKE
jgi:hypothetical protein